MIKNSLLVIFLILVMNLNCQARDEPPTKEQLQALDNTPNDCIENGGNGPIIDDSKASSRVNVPEAVTSVGGKVLTGAPISLRRMIDGPANLRDKPNGKVISSFPHKFTVLLEGQKGDWFYLRGYKERACEGGWTYKTNIFKR